MNRHDSQRGWFAYELYQKMAKNKDIYLITADLGYKVFDNHFKDFPERSINCGAAEQVGCGMSVGLALEGKIPFFYSITPFLLCRPFEWIRNYINHESIPVILVGSGYEKDYRHDGFTHDATDAKKILDLFPNISQYWPKEKEDISTIINDVLQSHKPSSIILRR